MLRDNDELKIEERLARQKSSQIDLSSDNSEDEQAIPTDSSTYMDTVLLQNYLEKTKVKEKKKAKE